MMTLFNTDHPCVVLGLYETGLGVSRSLARKGIDVIGVDFKKDIGFRSRFVKPYLCPHPLKDPDVFLEFMIELSKRYTSKPVLFLTADEFVLAISRMRERLVDDYLFNISPRELIECIMNKDCQYMKAQRSGIPIPRTFRVNTMRDVEKVRDEIGYPSFIKGCLSYIWREHFGSVKGLIVKDEDELFERTRFLTAKDVPMIVQEIVRGPDTNHFKYCCYISKQGNLLLDFTLQKIRQQPIRFGIGASVRSINYHELSMIGKKLFSAFDYRGVGSAEFKLDENDHKLKLIELNPRYWQQNILGDRCGMNFPLVDYLETTDQGPVARVGFLSNVKWINVLMDFNSFLSYRRERMLGISEWFVSLRGTKVFSDFASDDMLPVLTEKKYWYLIIRLWHWVCKRFRLARCEYK